MEDSSKTPPEVSRSPHLPSWLELLKAELDITNGQPVTSSPIHRYSLYSPESLFILQGEGKGHRSRKKMVTIPAGSTLAFRVAQLIIGSKWGERQGTVSRAWTVWQRSRESGRHQVARGTLWTSGFMISQTGWPSVPGTDVWVIGAGSHEVPGALGIRELVTRLLLIAVRYPSCLG